MDQLPSTMDSRMLHLNDNRQLSDAGLLHLLPQSELAELQVKKTRVTAVGVELPRAKRPRCQVEFETLPAP